MPEKNLTKGKLSVYKSKAQTAFRFHFNPKHTLIEPKKAQNDPKNQKIKKGKNKKDLQNESS